MTSTLPCYGRGLWLRNSHGRDLLAVLGVNSRVPLSYRRHLSRCMIGYSTFLSSRHPSVRQHVWPFDLAWGTALPDVDQQQIAANLFASSIVPYAGFLYHLHRSKQAQKTMLVGWYYLLVFVAATIPAGIYAKVHYHTILANVDWLHGLAEANLTITNLLIVLGLRQAIREAEEKYQPEAEEKYQPEAKTDKLERQAETESRI